MIFAKEFLLLKQKKLTFAQTSERFDIPLRTLFRWHHCLEPCTTRNKPATKIDMAALANDVQDHPDSYQWERALKQRYQAEGKSLFYLDESGFAYDMPRTRGYSTPSIRCYGQQDWHARGRVNAIGAMHGSTQTLLTLALFETNIDGDVFFAWLKVDLLSKLPEQMVLHKKRKTINPKVAPR